MSDKEWVAVCERVAAEARQGVECDGEVFQSELATCGTGALLSQAGKR